MNVSGNNGNQNQNLSYSESMAWLPAAVEDPAELHTTAALTPSHEEIQQQMQLQMLSYLQQMMMAQLIANGQQQMIAALNNDDMEQPMQEPENEMSSIQQTAAFDDGEFDQFPIKNEEFNPADYLEINTHNNIEENENRCSPTSDYCSDSTTTTSKSSVFKFTAPSKPARQSKPRKQRSNDLGDGVIFQKTPDMVELKNPNMVRKFPGAENRTPEERLQRERNRIAARYCRAKAKRKEAVLKEKSEKLFVENVNYKRSIACRMAYANLLLAQLGEAPVDWDLIFHTRVKEDSMKALDLMEQARRAAHSKSDSKSAASEVQSPAIEIPVPAIQAPALAPPTTVVQMKAEPMDDFWGPYEAADMPDTLAPLDLSVRK